MTFYAPFCIPFIAGAALMFAVLLWKWGTWLWKLPRADKMLILKGLPTRRTLDALCEVVSESLLHRRIFRVNPLLGYMHMSLAFGWFLLIAFGWVETLSYLGLRWVPLQGHVFFKYFATGLEHKPFFDFVMDLLLLFVLSGVALAWGKRFYSKAMGLRRTTRHVVGDRVALSALWFIFPARLVAESVTCAIYGGGGFLTGGFGHWLAGHVDMLTLMTLESVAWWFYSSCLGLFFVALPFSRYMHIFTEIPLIFLRRYRLRSTEKESSYDHFQVEACSRCGICIDPCQLQSVLGINDVQSVYFLRDRRYRMLRLATADNCLMCGRCVEKCPVDIDLNTLRLNSRDKMRNTPDERRYGYFKGLDRSRGEGKVGYFAGCMTLLTPRTLTAMEQLFRAAGEEVWWADREGGVCCGRPLKLAGETDSARKMMQYNTDLFRKHGITTLVTSCPICLKVFREDYALDGIEVLHHSEYILRLIRSGRLQLKHGTTRYTYHDPCELGRGSGIYDEPRAVIEAVGELLEPAETRENALCCGSSVANLAISDSQQVQIARSVTGELEATGAEVIVTACPLCKKALARGAQREVKDLAEIVAASMG
ncbi:(Fe-S)-binding protein [uncultured Alistipes sp.]|uniref:(Fe-S)-binding protein n=1 Tax=uncultured Alistipes sp. TaxID=538949 RepID=UPI001FA58FF5|nr:(Fe-S)-binding protein [uncultured Alistipes sp.]HJC18014.1 (Fe-S)-binding protein [Candidatus Alistipes stercorigallinarum]